MGDRNPAVRELFFAALDKKSPQEIATYLDEVCSADPLLRSRVEHLLRAHQQAGRFLGGSFTDNATIEHRSIDERAGEVIGPYKLLEQIGEGGFGVVFMAEQTEPVRRKVALKIVKPGMDTRQVIARFEAERQALALMDHPNIARVLDAEATASGRPYFVMELVHGTPITQFCDLQKLSPAERLKLFIDVCRAVQHAHQKGVIHRDLKPSNVMVTMHDDKAVPKIIDFGVSKAISHQLTEKTLFTAYGQMVGTPMYMSPEQAQLSGLDVDTRSDIYSLGVLLYELMTGTTPFDEATLNRVGFDEMRRMIREEEPPRPSARVSTLKGDLLSTVADQRRIDPRKLSHSLRGEVDWIVMKALEKDRNRRYDSANALAVDIERYLNDEPVQACPPSMRYRAGKFMRRHKTALASAGFLAVVLMLAVAGLAVGTALVWRANKEAHDALEQRRRLSYFQQVALAEREWASNNFTRAEELIQLCPADLRGWEWNYLRRMRGNAIPPMRHQNMVWDCAISPDGDRVVSTDFTGLVYCWDAHTGREVRPPFRGHDTDGGGYSVFSFDGKHFATSGWDDIKVWNAHTGEQLHTWQAPGGTIQGLAFSRDGRLLACVSLPAGDGDVASIWDALTGKQLFDVKGLERIVQSIVLNPDGTLLALSGEDGTVRIVNSHTGEPVRTLRADGATKFWHAAFSPDGTLLAAANCYLEGEQGSGAVWTWEVETGRRRATLTGHGPMCVAFSPDGQRLATGGTDQTVKIWDAASGEEILTLRGHIDFVRSVAFTPDGHRLLSSSDDRSLRIWDGSPWKDGEEVGDDTVTLRGHGDSVNVLAFHPHELQLATGSTDGTVKLWDTCSWRESSTFPTRLERVERMAFAPDGSRLAIAGNPSRAVTLLDAATGAELQRLEVPDAAVVISIAFSSDGQFLAAGDDGGCVTVFDAATGAMRYHLKTPSRFAYSVAFSPEHAGLVAAATVNGSVRIWETDTGREIEASPLAHQATLVGIAFSPDGEALASVGWDRTVRVWDTTTWKQSQIIIDAIAAANCIAFSPDSQFMAWGASDSTVKLYHRASGEIRTLRGHLGWIGGIAFSPDGRLLASASEDGTVKIWTVPWDDPLAQSSKGDER